MSGVANDNARRAVVRVTRKADPKRLDRIADILLDIVETANRLDAKNNPEEGRQP